ncbi:hypothetical protein QBC39DRAFT_348913 [Podospora conica]|nr:hypothetical protein QBC39DRAFT_348913 [Schizothecium conicum]
MHPIKRTPHHAVARLAQSVERETLIHGSPGSEMDISRLWVRPPRRAQFPSSTYLFAFFCFTPWEGYGR